MAAEADAEGSSARDTVAADTPAFSATSRKVTLYSRNGKIIIPNGNTALLDRVNESLATMKEDGTLEQLEAEWLGGGGSSESASPQPSAS